MRDLVIRVLLSGIKTRALSFGNSRINSRSDPWHPGGHLGQGIVPTLEPKNKQDLLCTIWSPRV